VAPTPVGDTYHAERHPVAARVLRNTLAQTALTRSDARIDALRDTMSELLGMDEPRTRIAGMICGLDGTVRADGCWSTGAPPRPSRSSGDARQSDGPGQPPRVSLDWRPGRRLLG
jgi:hypothetical protein